jgi:trk system potassium uptake protein TrkH
MLMFIGCCAGSTAGGIKVARILLATKVAKNEINCQIRPNSLRYIKYDGKKVSENTISTMNAFLKVYMCIFIISVFLIFFENYDLETTISSVAETLNNICIGLGEIGPKNNFNIFHYIHLKYYLYF